MKIIDPYFEILSRPTREDAIRLLELAGRTCYKSEDRITPDSSSEFVRRIMKSGHHSVIEHVIVTVKFVCSRAIMFELRTHRLASFSAESTRYCNYSGGLTFIRPEWLDIPCGEYVRYFDIDNFKQWNVNGKIFLPKKQKYHGLYSYLDQIFDSEIVYTHLLGNGWRPEQAREVLPNSTKTEIVMTANLREWLHVFELRCSPAAHPEMRRIMVPLRDDLRQWLPEIFGEQE